MPQILKEPASRFMVLGVGFMLFIMACSATVLYWSLDLQPPFAGVSGTFKGWDEHDPTIGRVEWTGQRYRYCDGKVSRWVINNGRYVHFSRSEFSGSSDLPPEEQGRADTVYAKFEIPWGAKQQLVQPKYRIRIEYACNPLQRIFPIVVSPPEIPLSSAISESSANAPAGIPNGESSR